MSFCPVCGEDAVDVFCERCLREREPLVSDVRALSYHRCSTCDRVLIRNAWKKPGEWLRVLDKSVVFNPRALITDVDAPLPVVDADAKEFSLPVVVTGTVSKMIPPYEEEYTVSVVVEKEPCDRCRLANSSYFEGVLQLRRPRDDAVSFIEGRVAGEDAVFITKAVDVRGGIDFYFSDQTYLLRFAHELRDRFGGELRVESRLHTYDRQKSKKVFRLTVLVRLPVFGPGAVIETDKRLFLVRRMGRLLRGFDLRRRKRTKLSCPLDGEYVLHEPFPVVVSSVQPRVTVLNPEDYQEVEVAVEAPVVPGSEASVVVDGRGRWYVAEELVDS